MIERTFIEQGMKKIQLEQYMLQHLDKAGFTGLEIVKTPLVTRIVLNVARPGLAIGKGGQNIRMLTNDIGERFGIQNPQIEIRDIKQPELDSKATVDRMIGLIERGYSWRSVAFRTVQDIMRAGAQGVEMVLKGKLSGKGGRKRKQRIAQGYMKKVGDQVKLVDFAKGAAYPKAGAIGIKLSIIHPGVIFPDKINIKELIEKKAAGEAKAEEARKAEAEKQAAGAAGEGQQIAAAEATGTAVVATEHMAIVAVAGQAKEEGKEKAAGAAGGGKEKKKSAKKKSGKAAKKENAGHEKKAEKEKKRGEKKD